MGNTLTKRGMFQLTEVPMPADVGTAERIQSVLRRIEHQACDTPVVVSAGFLRWMGAAYREFNNDRELARLRDQITILIQERDDAREEAQRLKANRDSLSTRVQIKDVSTVSLIEIMAKSHGLNAATSRKR